MGLQRYDHLPAVRAARKGLAVQQADMLLNVWLPHHHVCENYDVLRQNASAPTPSGLPWTGTSQLSAAQLVRLPCQVGHGH